MRAACACHRATPWPGRDSFEMTPNIEIKARIEGIAALLKNLWLPCIEASELVEGGCLICSLQTAAKGPIERTLGSQIGSGGL